MKRALIIASVALSSMALVAFTSSKEVAKEFVHISVVHHADGQVVVLDTTFEAASGYTVEQFLIDNGLDPESTDIIQTNQLNGTYTQNLMQDVWFVNEKPKMERRMIFISDEEGGAEQRVFEGKDHPASMEVKLMKLEEDGEVKYKKFVNGEEVRITPAELEKMESNSASGPKHVKRVVKKQGSEGEGSKGAEGETLDVQVEKTIENGEEVIQMWINGEEVNPEDHPELLDPQAGEGQEIEIIIDQEGGSSGENVFIKKLGEDGPEMKFSEETQEVEVQVTLDENGEEQVTMWINGEEVDPEDHEDLLNHEGGEGEDIEIIIIEGGEGENSFEIETEDVFILEGENGESMAWTDSEGMTYTIALVTTFSGEEENVPTPKAQELEISDLTFAPNPNTGQFNLSFTLHEQDQTRVVIFDAQGREVYLNKLGNFSGAFNESIDISGEGPGTYILNVVQGNKKMAEKLIVQ
ncbi:MAG: T9SS type A sorting domain-containing protein [Flavobacteriales bacterium]|nr:T9SS type A sorting domain-containing protein [Flavobacteriales bacterium]